METAKIFENGRSQAVRLPKKFRFSDEEVLVQRLGEAVILLPKEAAWRTFMNGLESFTDDFLKDGREAQIAQPSATACNVHARYEHLHLRDNSDLTITNCAPGYPQHEQSPQLPPQLCGEPPKATRRTTSTKNSSGSA